MGFTFNDYNCENFGVYVEKYPERQIPKKKYSEYNVPGKSGKVFVPQGGYENVVQTYEVYVKGGVTGFQARAAQISHWLLTPDEPCVLRDTYDPNVFRYATYIGGVNWENSLNKYGKVKVSFDCSPLRYDFPQTVDANGTTPDGSPYTVTIGTGFPKGNGYVDDPKPLLELYPASDGDFNSGCEIHLAIENTETGERSTVVLVCTNTISNSKVFVDTGSGQIYIENKTTGERSNIEDYFTVTMSGDFQMDFTTRIQFDLESVLFDMVYRIYGRWYKL